MCKVYAVTAIIYKYELINRNYFHGNNCPIIASLLSGLFPNGCVF